LILLFRTCSRRHKAEIWPQYIKQSHHTLQYTQMFDHDQIQMAYWRYDIMPPCWNHMLFTRIHTNFPYVVIYQLECTVMICSFNWK
jgi:hypothetical protein